MGMVNNCLDIGHYPFINFKSGCVYRTKYEDALGANAIHSTLEYSDAEAIKRAVLDGLGISVLPYLSVELFLADKTLVELVNAPQLTLVLSVVFRKNKVLSPATRALLTTFSEHANLSSGLANYLDPDK